MNNFLLSHAQLVPPGTGLHAHNKCSPQHTRRCRYLRYALPNSLVPNHECILFVEFLLDSKLRDEFLDRVIEAIIEAAKTGKVGDGKIFVTDLAQVYRIRTGETGDQAI